MGAAMGAYAAHGAAPEAARLLSTASVFQLLHAAALLAILPLQRSKTVGAARFAFAVGPALFCGAVYAFALTGDRAAALPAPIGGGLMILGWCALIVAALTRRA